MNHVRNGMRSTRSALRDPLNILAFLAILALVAASILGQADAHYYAGGPQYERHTMWVLIGTFTFIFATFIDLRLIERSAYVIYGICIALLILTLLLGTSVNASTRWLRLGDINIQPSEFMKLGVIIALARLLHGRRERRPGETLATQEGSYDFKTLVRPLALVLAPAPLILLQPDLGTTLLVLFVAATMLAAEGISRRTTVILTVITLVAIPVIWKSGFVHDYQKDRVFKLVDDSWEKVDKETGVIHESRRTQAEQAMWAIGSGGLSGQGYRNANAQRMKVFPEVHTDFISAMVAEEYGFLGLTGLLLLFWWLVMWGLRTALDARDRFCRLVATGVASLFAWQVFVNVGMVSGFLPVVGVPLPFLSYGGSAFTTALIGLGLILNVARRRGRL